MRFGQNVYDCLHYRHEKSHPHNDEGYIGMRSSASHDSIIENRLQAKPGHRYPPLVDQRHAHYDHDFYHQNKNRQDYHHKTKEPKHRQPSKKRYDYGVIPAPLKTAKQSASKISVRTEDHRNQPKEIHRDLAENYGYPPPFRAYPPHPSQDEYSKSSNRLSAALHHGYMEREDERCVLYLDLGYFEIALFLSTSAYFALDICLILITSNHLYFCLQNEFNSNVRTIGFLLNFDKSSTRHLTL